MIKHFTGSWAALSNFSRHPVRFEGSTYPTAEHAFQAAKTIDKSKRQQIKSAYSPTAAKLLGRRVMLREDWEDIKDDVMLTVLRSKFRRNIAARQVLLLTGDEQLVEGNTWHDNYWGVCSCARCKGNKQEGNRLGQLLMQIRDEIR